MFSIGDKLEINKYFYYEEYEVFVFTSYILVTNKKVVY